MMKGNNKPLPCWTIAVWTMVLAAGSAATVHAQSLKVKQSLAPTHSDPGAYGSVRFVLHSPSNAKLVVSAGGLSTGASFDVIADGVKVGTLDATPSGTGKTRFFTNPSPGNNFLGFDPRGASMTVRDSGSGKDVLVGSVPTTSVDPTTIACCLPDDDGSECDALTATECTAEGGTATSATTCLPDPCGSTSPPPGTSTVCCIPDDGGPECEDQSDADCASNGGMVVQATSCDANPCAPTPPAQGEVPCCVPQDGDSPECEVLTPDACTAISGTPAQATATSCTPDPCNGGGDDQGEDDNSSANSGEGGDS